MIFNLVEAAQEFLSEIVPVGQSHESVSFAAQYLYAILSFINLWFHMFMCSLFGKLNPTGFVVPSFYLVKKYFLNCLVLLT